MLCRWSAPLLVLFLLALAPVWSASAQEGTSPTLQSRPIRQGLAGRRYVPGQVLVRLRDSAAPRGQGLAATKALQTRFSLVDLSGVREIAPATFRLEVGANADVPALAEQLAADPAVEYAQPNYLFTALRTVNDPLSTFQYALGKINAYGAWDITTGSNGVTVAVIDTGVNANHPDLAGRVLPGYDFVNNDRDASDDEGHGTHTAGIVAASGDNGQGVAGMCWQCKILPVKVLDNEGVGTNEWVASGIRWAADHGARVINLSLGGEDDTPLIHEAVRYAAGKNVLVVVAAGNSFEEGNPIQYPAAYDEAFTVGASDDNDQRAFFSGVQSYVDISAPGWNIPSTVDVRGIAYEALSGTSEAAPHVAGLAGLMLSVNPGLDVNALRSLISSTADDLGQPGVDAEFGAGRINAGRAVAAVRVPSFDPVGNPNQAGVAFFPETQHTLRGEFRRYWELNGGLPVFGFPISEEFQEATAEGAFMVQYFERNRFEYHPEKPAPYNVLLGRLSDKQLRNQGRDWFTFPKGQPTDGCMFFAETGHSVCEPFLSYWRNNGLRDPQLAPDGRSLALFGLPLSEPMPEINSSGDNVLTQWFERARFEFHPDKPGQYQVLLGLLGNETARLSTGSVPPSNQSPPDRCGVVQPSVDATVRPGGCIVVGTFILIDAFGFAPNETISLFVSRDDGRVAPQEPLRANGEGKVSIGAGFAFPPGVYGIVMRGTQSGHQSVVYVRSVDR